jgi:midasin
MQRPWSEAKRMEVERDCVGDMATVDAKVCFDLEASGDGYGFVPRMVDGWLLPFLESRRLQDGELTIQRT